MPRLKYDTVVWSSTENGAEEFFGFPQGFVETPHGHEVLAPYPNLGNGHWKCLGVLPAGQPVGDSRAVTGHRVKVSVSGLSMNVRDTTLRDD
jgi:hypothetical protein